MPRLESEDLYGLEDYYKCLDLKYSFSKTMGTPYSLPLIRQKKQETADKINEILISEISAHGKTCSSCGCHLSWDYPFGMCEKCFSGMSYRSRYGRDSYSRQNTARTDRGEWSARNGAADENRVSASERSYAVGMPAKQSIGGSHYGRATKDRNPAARPFGQSTSEPASPRGNSSDRSDHDNDRRKDKPVMKAGGKKKNSGRSPGRGNAGRSVRH